MKISKTERGFDLIEFTDKYGHDCVIQKSSIATQNCIWIGRKHSSMHLNRDQVSELMPILQKFIETGDIV